MRNPLAFRRPVVAVPTPPDPAELAALERGDRGFGPLVRLLREREKVPAAAVLRLVPGASEEDLARVESGAWRPSVDWVRAYAMATTATFTSLFDVWDREAPGGAERMTVAEAVAMCSRLRETSKGVVCPVCAALVVVRKRTLNEPVASFVAWLSRHYNGRPLNALGWVDTHEHLSRGGTYARAAHWGLATREPGEEPLWSPTNKGRRWAAGLTKVHRHAVIFRGAVLRFDGAEVGIADVASGEEIQRGMGPTPMLPGVGP
jgi:hypothetical protein